VFSFTLMLSRWKLVNVLIALHMNSERLYVISVLNKNTSFIHHNTKLEWWKQMIFDVCVALRFETESVELCKLFIHILDSIQSNCLAIHWTKPVFCLLNFLVRILCWIFFACWCEIKLFWGKAFCGMPCIIYKLDL